MLVPPVFANSRFGKFYAVKKARVNRDFKTRSQLLDAVADLAGA